MVIMKLDFLTILWLFPITLLIHELEEWNILKWYDRHFVDMPRDKSNASTRFFLIFISVVCFLWTGVAVATQREQVAVWIMLPFVGIVVQNIFQHIYWLFLFRSYAPGIISAILLLLPVNGYILFKGFGDGMISWPLLSSLIVYWVFAMVETIRAKNTLTGSFRTINRFSNYMVRKLNI